MPCECKPCKRVVWQQRASWYVRRPGPLPDVSTSWHEEWPESKAGDYGHMWDCAAKPSMKSAGIADKPYFSVVTFAGVSWWGFAAESYVKCAEGKEAGVVYGRVRWGARWSYDVVTASGPLIQ